MSVPNKPAQVQTSAPETFTPAEGNGPSGGRITTRLTPPPPNRNQPGGVRGPPRETPAEEDEADEPVSLLARLRAFDVGSAAALLCGSVALLFASIPELDFLIKPLGALGLLVGLLAGVLPAVRKRTNVPLPIVVSVLCLLVLLFVGSWPNASAPPPPPMAAIPLQQKGLAPRQSVGTDDWVDAAANAVRKDDVRVQVVSARIGRVDMKIRSGTVQSPDRHLVIRLRVSYEGIVFQQIPYDPWADRAGSPSKHPPTLTDNRDRNYAQKAFDPGWRVAGRTDGEMFSQGHQLKEVLIFPVPPADVEYLRLTLPASAFGLAGEFRFQLPRGMIQAL